MPAKMARTEGGISVERLTDHENEHYNQPGCNSCSDYRWRSCKESGEIDDCIQRLTWLRLLDIEDILGDDYDLDRLKELVQADRDGKCVVLPCKYNDDVYFIKSAFSMAHFPIEANHVSIRGIDCDGDIIYAAITAYNGIERKFKGSDIGKTVFHTREEAEKALKERENNG